jgi:hypothetical protein
MIFSKICAPKVPKETLRKPIIAPNLIKIGFIIIHITLSSFLTGNGFFGFLSLNKSGAI